MLKMLEIIVVLGALVFVGMILSPRNYGKMKSAVPCGPQIGDCVRYEDKRTGNIKGHARIKCFRRDGLITLRHGLRARQFSVHSSRIIYN